MTLQKHIIIPVLAALLAAPVISESADWTLPLTVTSGAAQTGVVLGIDSTATDGFDAGQDSPTPFTEETLNAYFSHPEWNLTFAGTPVSAFHRDIRGTVPQTFSLRIKTELTPVTVTWDSALVPATVQAVLKTNGEAVDMRKAGSYQFAPASQLTIVDFEITPGDTTPPSVPANLVFAVKDSSIFLTWDANQETDLAGYRLYLLDGSGTVIRSVDMKKSTNYNLMNVLADVPYNLAVSAYDTTGNESIRTTAIAAVAVTQPQVPLVADGDVDGDGRVTVADAIKVLRMALNLDPVTSSAMTRGDFDGDGKLTIRDVMRVVRKAIGL